MELACTATCVRMKSYFGQHVVPGQVSMGDCYSAGGGLFGIGFPAIVTRFHLNVRKIYSNMRASTFIYPMAQYKTVMNWIIQVFLSPFILSDF
jgi:hypothetical protein